jgi:hypothetical protein
MKFSRTCPYNERDRLPPVNALYAVYSNETVLYIGTAFGLRRRFRKHTKASEFMKNNVTHVCWNEYKDTQGAQLEQDERFAIELFRPALNRNLGGRSTKLSTSPAVLHGKDTSTNSNRSRLHQATFELLWKRIKASLGKTQALDQIAAETGLSYAWLDHLARDLGGSPSVDRIERLYEFLSGEQLKV